MKRPHIESVARRSASPKPLLGIALVAFVLGCSSSATEDVALRPGELARVGDALVPRPLVEWTLAREERAWPALEHDLLLARELERSSPGRARVVARGAQARALLESLSREAAKLGPPTPEEWARERQSAWLEIDRPRSVRVLDAFLPVEPLAPDAAAHELAVRIADAVQGAHTQDDFIRLGSAVVQEEGQVKLTTRPPLAADGRIVPLEARDAKAEPVDVELARAANRFEHVGEVSGVVGLNDGFHILLALEIHDAIQLDEAEIERRLAPRVFARRAAPEFHRLEAELKARGVVTVTPHSEALTRLVWRQP